MVTVNLTDIIGSTTAISPRTGQKAYEFAEEQIKQGHAITIRFSGVTDCTSAFCNTFVGKLYMNFSPADIDRLVVLEVPAERELWRKKLDNAKLLGTNENVRADRIANIENLLYS